MSHNVERADSSRLGPRRSTFPEPWGPPPGSPGARSAWVALNVSRDLTAAGRAASVKPLLPASQVRQLTPQQRRTDPRIRAMQMRLELLSKRFGPHE